MIITTRTKNRHFFLTNTKRNFLFEQNARVPFQLSLHSTVVGTRSFQLKSYIFIFRYLLQSKGKDRTPELFLKYQESLEKLHEMAEILINKRLIC